MEMAQAISAVLAFAVGVGSSPIPIIAGILMLFSSRAKVNGPVFLVAWITGLTAVMTVIVVAAEMTDIGSGSTADDGQSWFKVALGILLLAGAGRRWRDRPGPDDEPTMPAWMNKIDTISPTGAFWLGLGLSANPKNLALAFGAATSLVTLSPSSEELLVGMATFILIGSAFLIGAVGYAMVGGERARHSLDDAKAWLTQHNSAVMAVLFLVFGAVLISNGLGRV
jgi:Mn2+/Fe2+ NRAMP family transporter